MAMGVPCPVAGTALTSISATADAIQPVRCHDGFRTALITITTTRDAATIEFSAISVCFPPSLAASRPANSAGSCPRQAASQASHPSREAPNLRGPPFEPWHALCRQMDTGGLHYPDLAQRHQASFGLGALLQYEHRRIGLANGDLMRRPISKLWDLRDACNHVGHALFRVAGSGLKSGHRITLQNCPQGMRAFHRRAARCGKSSKRRCGGSR